MEIEEYMGATEATELKFPNGLKLNDVQITFLSQAAASAHNSGNALDALKKHLVYGKDIGLAVDGELANEVELTSEQAEILHAALGKVTESIEFFDAVINWIAGKEPDRVNLAEEVGDGWWYDRCQYRQTGCALPREVQSERRPGKGSRERTRSPTGTPWGVDLACNSKEDRVSQVGSRPYATLK
jgi:hypothetical protein